MVNQKRMIEDEMNLIMKRKKVQHVELPQNFGIDAEEEAAILKRQ